LKKINDRVHWSIEIDRESSRNYCMKMQDYFIKDKRDQGARTDLKSVCDIVQTRGLAAAVADYPEVYVKFHSGIEKLNAFYRGIPRDQKPYVVWIYGPTGTGKTRMVYEQEKSSLWMSGKNLQWWDGYDNQDAVLFDDFRGDFCTFHYLLRVLDRYPMRVEVKGSSREFNSKRIYITSCYPPTEIYNKSDEDVKQLIRRIDEIIFLSPRNGIQTQVQEDRKAIYEGSWKDSSYGSEGDRDST